MPDSSERIDPSRAKFIFSLPRWKEGMAPDLPMVVVAGRSNVGKSSFINMLLKRKNLARTSCTPGRTQLLNFFDVDGRLILVDVPGYGYAKAPPEEVRRWTENVRDLVREARGIRLVIQLLDIRRDPSKDDLAFAGLVKEAGKELLLVVTKADKEVKGKRLGRLTAIAKEMGVEKGGILLTSSEEGIGRQEVWKKVLVATGLVRQRIAGEPEKLKVVALDGPAGSGKSTVARAVAKALGWNYLDTGAMYRAVGLKAHRLGISMEDDPALEKMCAETKLQMSAGEDGTLKILMDGMDVSAAIRENQVSSLASMISARKPVREAMGRFQRKIGEGSPTVAEGRDMGTVIFPDAKVKIFLTASPETRAKRRAAELAAMGQEADYERILSEIIKRDGDDSSREHAPLKPAEDAYHLDTSDKGIEEVVREIVARV